MKHLPTLLSIFSFFALLTPLSGHSGTTTKAITSGKAYADFRLRFESVDQDNALKDSDALTLRSRVGYETASHEGFSGVNRIRRRQSRGRTR